MYLKYPIFTANVLFFLNVTVGFWLIGMYVRLRHSCPPYIA